MRLVCDVECRGEKRIAALEAENATLRAERDTAVRTRDEWRWSSRRHISVESAVALAATR